MKIITKGRTDPETVRFNCNKCGCVFEAVKMLEAQRVNDQRDGDFWSCRCPQCDKHCTKAA